MKRLFGFVFVFFVSGYLLAASHSLTGFPKSEYKFFMRFPLQEKVRAYLFSQGQLVAQYDSRESFAEFRKKKREFENQAEPFCILDLGHEVLRMNTTKAKDLYWHPIVGASWLDIQGQRIEDPAAGLSTFRCFQGKNPMAFDATEMNAQTGEFICVETGFANSCTGNKEH